MEDLRPFLESSTIHGLAYIATTRKNVRLFWILVVMAGFIGAGFLIHTSFLYWADSPVKTTMETLPITEITFPKVTVCPPKNTYTDLNYDLMMTKNMTLDNDTRKELTKYTVDLLYNHLYDTLMTNLSKLEDKDRYYNWYHGYTEINLPMEKLPYLTLGNLPFFRSNGVYFYVFTSATSGNISTQYFGDKFEADKVEPKVYYKVYISPPDSVRNQTNVTLHFEIDKLSLKDLSSGEDRLWVSGLGKMNTYSTHGSYNHTPPSQGSYNIGFRRNVNMADVRKQKLKQMPGFRFTWHYSGMEVKPVAKYATNMEEKPWTKIGTKAFIRIDSI